MIGEAVVVEVFNGVVDGAALRRVLDGERHAVGGIGRSASASLRVELGAGARLVRIRDAVVVGIEVAVVRSAVFVEVTGRFAVQAALGGVEDAALSESMSR
jgi:hypothetical protein